MVSERNQQSVKLSSFDYVGANPTYTTIAMWRNGKRIEFKPRETEGSTPFIATKGEISRVGLTATVLKTVYH